MQVKLNICKSDNFVELHKSVRLYLWTITDKKLYLKSIHLTLHIKKYKIKLDKGVKK